MEKVNNFLAPTNGYAIYMHRHDANFYEFVAFVNDTGGSGKALVELIKAGFVLHHVRFQEPVVMWHVKGNGVPLTF